MAKERRASDKIVVFGDNGEGIENEASSRRVARRKRLSGCGAVSHLSHSHDLKD